MALPARPRLDSPRLRWFVEYGCRDDFGATLAQTSAWAGIHYFAARLGDSGHAADFLTWPEGNGRLVSHLAARAGNRLRTQATVRRVTPHARGVDVVYHDEREGRLRGIHAEHAVFALPRFLAGTSWTRRPRPAAGVVYGSWMVANLTLRDRPESRGFPLAWDNVLYESPSLGYVVATHQPGRDHGPTVFTYYLPAARRRPARRAAAAAGHAVGGVGGGDPRRPGAGAPRPRATWSRRWTSTSGATRWSARGRDRCGARPWPRPRRPLGRLHFAHTDLSGMALFEEAQY